MAQNTKDIEYISLKWHCKMKTRFLKGGYSILRLSFLKPGFG